MLKTSGHVFICQASLQRQQFRAPRCSCGKMAFNTVAGVLVRALRSGGNGTPPLLRSAKLNGLSVSRTLSGGNQQDREVAKSSGPCTDTDGPGNDGPSSSEGAHKSTPADKKGTKGAPGVRGERRRSFTSAAPADTKSYMWARYNDTKRLVHGKLSTPPPFTSTSPHVQQPPAPSVVFASQRHCCCYSMKTRWSLVIFSAY